MLTVLIADDEHFVRNGLIKNLKWEELGIGLIEQADDGINAFEKAMAVKPDILVTDVRMPRMGGIELAAKVREIFPDCKVIFMSAYSDKQYLKSAIHLKAISYVEKPIDPSEISKAIFEAASACIRESNKRSADQDNENNLKKSLQILRNNIANEFIQPNWSESQIISWLNAAGIQIPLQGCFSVILIKFRTVNRAVDSESNPKKDILLKISENIIIRNGIKCITGFKNYGNIIAIAYSDSNAEIQLNSNMLEILCRDLLSELCREAEIFVCSGAIVSHIKNIYQSYQSAVVKSQTLFFEGYNTFSVNEPDNTAVFQFDEALAGIFMRNMENLDRESALRTVYKLTCDLKQYKSTLANYVKNFYFKLLIQITNSASKRKINLFSEDSESFLWETISSYDTLDEIQEYLVKLINTYFKQIEDAEGVSRIISDIEKIIAATYSNPELSIKLIADKLFLSHSYLCVIFKKETGKTINQFITEYRIDKAKELLEDRYIKLYDVTSRVGYADQNYFTKLFRKVTGMKPSEYREKYIK